MSATLQFTRGCWGLVGSLVDEIAHEGRESAEFALHSSYASPPYHITLLSKAELREVSQDLELLADIHPDTRHIFSAGVGGNIASGIVFVVIIWAAGQQIRKQLGLPPKQFHITLSTRDDHAMDKGIDSLLLGQFPSSPSPDFLDHLAFTLHISGQYHRAIGYCSHLVLLLPESHKGFLRLGDAAMWATQHKLAMLSYACAFERSDEPKVKSYCVKKMLECSKETEWGSTVLEDEKIQLPDEIALILLAPWSSELWNSLSNTSPVPTLCLAPRQSLFIPSVLPKMTYIKLPRFFRWLIPHYLAIMSTPRHEDDITALASPHLGIRHVLTLTEESPLPKSWFHGKSITNTYIPISNYHAPSIEQMDVIMQLFDDADKLPLLVHCGGGKGRAGTVAACYLAAFGFNRPRAGQTHPELSAEEAVSLLRAIRPGSIETSQQEAFVSKWCSTIWKRQSVYPEHVPEVPPCPLEIEGNLAKESDLFVLVGLPGSGKSWFSNALLARDRKGWTRISQDDSGSRALCETEIGRAHGRVLLDRCNTAASDRKTWLDLASNWVRYPVCVWFDYGRDLCTARAQMRAEHPTLPPGNRVRNAVDQMDKVFVRPTLKEGFKAILIIRSFSAAQELILRLSPAITMFKFPRTAHLIDLGAATSDDLVTDISTLSNRGHIIITEKVDGANMGFSLSSDRSHIVVQNRSHHVDSSTHEQFKKLGLWVERHREDLYKVLDRDPYFAERYILFGEWMFATHSIPYTHLPDRFMAFDIYDRSTGTFADRKTLSSLLEFTSIHLVPVIYEGTMPTDSELMNMVQLPSAYWDGRIEGVYVKAEKHGCVVFRGKVVRSDFIAGNEHWTKGNIRVNGLAPVKEDESGF